MKNETVTLNITDLTPEGSGVGRHDGKVFFVPLTAPQDECEVLILKENSSVTYGKLTKLLTPSPLRQKNDCSCFEKCGGCTLRHISYEAELELKQNFVKNAMTRIGGFDCRVLPTVFGDERRYRNKIQYPIGRDRDGNPVFGYYARRSHRIVPHGECLLQESIFCRIAECFCALCKEHGIKAYDEETSKGTVRHLVMRKNQKDEILLCIVAKNISAPKWRSLAAELMDRFDCITGIHLNKNDKATNVIFGEETVCLMGKKMLEDTLMGRDFFLSPRAFYQVNPKMTEKLYTIAKEKAELKKTDVVLDLYCGVGTVGLCVAGNENKLCGVEIIPEAVDDARRNAKKNGRSDKDTLFVCGDAAIGVRECAKKFGPPDVVLVDPPRKGLSPEVVKTILDAYPKKIVYISCNPATLARDCKLMAEAGYVLGDVTPVDMFPRTGHVESVVCLTRRLDNELQPNGCVN